MSAALRKAVLKVCTQLNDIEHELGCAVDDGKVAINTRAMHQAYELILVLARLIDGKSVYQSFGAPGDWGYETPIGAALFEFYRTPECTAVLATPNKSEAA